MEFNKENAQKLINRETYKNFILAYDSSLLYDKRKQNKLIKKFVEFVKEKDYKIYKDYDPVSFIDNDKLQPIFLDFLKELHRSNSKLSASESDIEFQIRLLKYFLAKLDNEDSSVKVDELLVERFISYCVDNHLDWLTNFKPVEYHMGGDRWDEDMGKKWSSFTLTNDLA